jgi:hypothetical protein
MSTDDGARELDRLQRWLQAAITGPRAVGADAESVVRRSSRMDALQRVGVYRDAYAVRLLECLADDYPALRALLGRERFTQLCERYIAALPPRAPSLNGYGEQLADFCASASAAEPWAQAPRHPPALLRDLARIEWAAVELIHAATAVPLAASDVLAREAGFADARLVAVPTLRLLRLEHRVHALYAVLRNGRRGAPLPAPAPGQGFVLLQRSDWEIVSDELPFAEGTLLADLLAGTAIGAALAAAAERGVSETDVGAWFQRWLQAGLFCALV